MPLGDIPLLPVHHPKMLTLGILCTHFRSAPWNKNRLCIFDTENPLEKLSLSTWNDLSQRKVSGRRSLVVSGTPASVSICWQYCLCPIKVFLFVKIVPSLIRALCFFKREGCLASHMEIKSKSPRSFGNRNSLPQVVGLIGKGPTRRAV